MLFRSMDKLSKVWQYKMFDQITSEQSYLYGGIWGCLKMLSFIKEKKIQSQKSYSVATKYEKDTKYIFLESVYNNPGIQNRKLACICDVSKARISQIVNEAVSDGLISVQEFGKEKCYFMRTLGENVYKIVHRQKNNLEENYRLLDYKMISFSNNENDFLTKYRQVNSILGKLSQNNKVVVAIAFAKKQDDIVSNSIFELKQEREDNLWMREKISLNRNCINSWNLQKEADMINQL